MGLIRPKIGLEMRISTYTCGAAGVQRSPGSLVLSFSSTVCALGTRRRRLHLWGACDPGCAAIRVQGRIMVEVDVRTHTGLLPRMHKSVHLAQNALLAASHPRCCCCCCCRAAAPLAGPLGSGGMGGGGAGAQDSGCSSGVNAPSALPGAPFEAAAVPPPPPPPAMAGRGGGAAGRRWPPMR